MPNDAESLSSILQLPIVQDDVSSIASNHEILDTGDCRNDDFQGSIGNSILELILAIESSPMVLNGVILGKVEQYLKVALAPSGSMLVPILLLLIMIKK